MSEAANSKNAEGVFEPFRVEAVTVESFAKGERFALSYQHLSSFGGGTQISVSLEVLAPGKQANQSHYHLLEEEHVFILEGGLTLHLGDKSFELAAGHYVCFPAGQAIGHWMDNTTAAPCRYLVLGNPQAHDVAVFPEPGRVSVKLTGEGYNRAQTLEYWQGVNVGGET